MCVIGNKRSRAIILRKIGKNESKISLLDRALGKIEGIVYKGSPSYGSLIEYSASCRLSSTHSSQYTVTHIELVDMPIELARQDVVFMHCVLEICYYFIPLASYDPSIFDLIQCIYNAKYWEKKYFQDLFLCKLLIILGFFPHHPSFQEKCFWELAQTPIDTLLQEHVNLELQSKIQEWVQACLFLHPQVRQFKTFSMRK